MKAEMAGRDMFFFAEGRLCYNFAVRFKLWEKWTLERVYARFEYENFCNFILNIIDFWKIGCQGDRMPMYRASAPFFEGDKGDRRVTGVGAHNDKMGKNRCF